MPECRDKVGRVSSDLAARPTCWSQPSNTRKLVNHGIEHKKPMERYASAFQ